MWIPRDQFTGTQEAHDNIQIWDQMSYFCTLKSALPVMLLPCWRPRFCPPWPSVEPQGLSPHTAPSASPSETPVSSLHLLETSRKHSKKNRRPGLEAGVKRLNHLFLERRLCCLLSPAGTLAAAPPEPWSCFSAGLHCSKTVWVRKEVLYCDAATHKTKIKALCSNLYRHLLSLCSLVHKGERLTSSRLEKPPACADMELKSSMPDNHLKPLIWYSSLTSIISLSCNKHKSTNLSPSIIHANKEVGTDESLHSSRIAAVPSTVLHFLQQKGSLHLSCAVTGKCRAGNSETTDDGGLPEATAAAHWLVHTDAFKRQPGEERTT